MKQIKRMFVAQTLWLGSFALICIAWSPDFRDYRRNHLRSNVSCCIYFQVFG